MRKDFTQRFSDLAWVFMWMCLVMIASGCDAGNESHDSAFEDSAIEGPTEEINFGSRPGGSKGIIEFAVFNGSGRELDISRVTSDCGCTVVDGYARSISPKSSSTLRATVHFPFREIKGPFSSSVVVNFSDGTSKRFLLKGVVVPELPVLVVMDPLRPNEQRQLIVPLSPIDTRTRYVVTKVTPPSMKAEIERLDNLQIGAETKIYVTVNAPSSAGKFEGAVTLAASDGMGERTLAIAGKVVGDYSVHPETIYVGELKDAVEKREIVVRRHIKGGATDWYSGLKIESNHPAVTGTIRPPLSSSNLEEVVVEIRVHGNAILTPTILNAKVTLFIEKNGGDEQNRESFDVNVVAVR